MLQFKFCVPRLPVCYSSCVKTIYCIVGVGFAWKCDESQPCLKLLNLNGVHRVTVTVTVLCNAFC
jgi:hypothetical protein